MLNSKRRGLLAFALLGAAMLAVPRLLSGRGTEVAVHDSAPGFRILKTDAVSLRMDPLIGLDSTQSDDPVAAAPADLCAALFGGGIYSDRPQVAYFTDANCPQCRILDRWLKDVPPSEAEITVHDLPLLGPSSVAAARAIGAAGLMGSEAQMRARLHRSRVSPNPAYLREIAEGLDLDAGRLLANLERPEVDARISQSLGAAAALGIPGTPALVIGDVVVIGRIEQAQFDRLLARYRPAPCMPARAA
ncbi:MAG: DsbA family protein [Rhodobacteraceae bacterium]|nr:DsbA family protein [Paracoccaceae bacterium]